MRFIISISPYFDEKFIKDKGEKLYFIFKDYLLNESKNNLRNLSKEKICDIINGINSITNIVYDE